MDKDELPIEYNIFKSEYFMIHKDEILEKAMINGFKIITAQIDPDYFLDNETNIWLPFNPNLVFDSARKGDYTELYKVIDDMTSYFEMTEDYEKCKVLLDIRVHFESGEAKEETN